MPASENNPVFWLAVLSLAEQATRDGLTGLYNRRYFDETLADHLATARRYERNLSLVLFDIDDFKAINDNHGHQAGDTALKHFAQLLKSTARAADIVSRHGGDEFAVILPETDREGADHFVHRVLKKQNYPTVSAGISTLPCDDPVAAADADLLAKKAASRPSPTQ